MTDRSRNPYTAIGLVESMLPGLSRGMSAVLEVQEQQRMEDLRLAKYYYDKYIKSYEGQQETVDMYNELVKKYNELRTSYYDAHARAEKNGDVANKNADIVDKLKLEIKKLRPGA